MNYSKALMVTRASKGLQQKEIAELLGVTPSYVSRIENGERPMSKKMIETLCTELGVPVELFTLLGQDAKNLDSQDSTIVDDLSKELLRIIND